MFAERAREKHHLTVCDVYVQMVKDVCEGEGTFIFSSFFLFCFDDFFFLFIPEQCSYRLFLSFFFQCDCYSCTFLKCGKWPRMNWGGLGK